jgi:hypothetical protein
MAIVKTGVLVNTKLLVVVAWRPEVPETVMEKIYVPALK